MPVYLYKCKSCGKEFNYEQKITDEALKTCPVEICEAECKGIGEVQRKISRNVGLVFNGSGFYLTDYKKKNTNPPEKSKETAPTKETKPDKATAA